MYLCLLHIDSRSHILLETLLSWIRKKEKKKKKKAGQEVAVFRQTLKTSDRNLTRHLQILEKMLKNFNSAPNFTKNWGFSTSDFAFLDQNFLIRRSSDNFPIVIYQVLSNFVENPFLSPPPVLAFRQFFKQNPLEPSSHIHCARFLLLPHPPDKCHTLYFHRRVQ